MQCLHSQLPHHPPELSPTHLLIAPAHVPSKCSKVRSQQQYSVFFLLLVDQKSMATQRSRVFIYTWWVAIRRPSSRQLMKWFIAYSCSALSLAMPNFRSSRSYCTFTPASRTLELIVPCLTSVSQGLHPRKASIMYVMICTAIW